MNSINECRVANIGTGGVKSEIAAAFVKTLSTPFRNHVNVIGDDSDMSGGSTGSKGGKSAPFKPPSGKKKSLKSMKSVGIALEFDASPAPPQYQARKQGQQKLSIKAIGWEDSEITKNMSSLVSKKEVSIEVQKPSMVSNMKMKSPNASRRVNMVSPTSADSMEYKNKCHMPVVYGSNVTMESPDPCSKFHSGPGPAMVSPVSPGATLRMSHSTPTPKKRAVMESINGFSPLPATPVGGEVYREEKQECAIPQIYGSNVTMESPDPNSKFHTGRGPAFASPMTPAPASSASESKDDDGFSPMPATPVGGEVYKEEKQECAIPQIYGSNVTMESPDPCSKYNKENVHSSANEIGIEYAPIGRLHSSQSAVDKTWRQSAAIEEAENIIEFSENKGSHDNEGYNTVPKVSSNNRHQNRRRMYEKANKSQQLENRNQNQAVNDLFTETLSPMKERNCFEVQEQTQHDIPHEFQLSDAAYSEIHYDDFSSITSIDAISSVNDSDNEEEDDDVYSNNKNFIPYKPVPPPSRTVTADVLKTMNETPKSIVEPDEIRMKRGRLSRHNNNTSIDNNSPEQKKPDSPPKLSGAYFRRGRILKTTKVTSPVTVAELVEAEEDLVVDNVNKDTMQLIERIIKVSHTESTFKDLWRDKKIAKRRLRFKIFEPRFEIIEEDSERELNYPSWYTVFNRLNIKKPLPLDSVKVIASANCDDDHNDETEDANSSSSLDLNLQQSFGRIRPKSKKHEILPEPFLHQDTYGLWMTKQRPMKHEYENDAPVNDINDFFKYVLNNDVGSLKSILGSSGDSLKGDTACDALGNTPLIAAVCSGNRNMTKILLKHGMDINACNAFGNSPLHFSLEFEFDEISNLLKKKGAKYCINEMGQRPGSRVDC